jgi:hypothetical protein
MTIKTKLIIISSVILIVAISILSFHIYDRHKANLKLTQDSAIVALASTIITDKQATVTLQTKLSTDLAPIHHLQPIAHAAKTEAIANVLQLETDHPAEKADIDLVAQPLEQAITDQEQVTEATQTALDDAQSVDASQDKTIDDQTALDDAQSVDASQDKTIDDQTAQLQNYQADIATTEQQVKTETTRKVWYRRCFFVVASIILIHIAL